MTCVCGARATYRNWRGSLVRYRCAACSRNYSASDHWQAELLVPESPKATSDQVFEHYRESRQRSPHVAPEEWGTLPRFADWQALEARYQAERRKGAA